MIVPTEIIKKTQKKTARLDSVVRGRVLTGPVQYYEAESVEFHLEQRDKEIELLKSKLADLPATE